MRSANDRSNPIDVSRRRLLVVVLTAVVVLGSLPGAALAQSESGVGGTVVVAEGETVDEVSVVAGTVIVDGTVTGDVSALAGNVYVRGDVGGDVSVATGNLEITGTVEGGVSAGAGNVLIGEDAVVGGAFEVGAGQVTIEGELAGDATIGAETITLGESASVGGDLRYGGDLRGNTDAVAGGITEDSTLGMEIAPTLQPFAGWVVAVYAFVLNLLLGAALLAVFPRFSAGVADRVATEPLRTGLAGLGVLVGVPLLIAALAITIVGIPVALAVALAFGFLVWVGIVYGRFAVAAWLLSYADVDNRWLALVVGLAGAALLVRIPFLGDLLNFLIFLLGLGALSVGLYVRARGGREPTTTGPEPGEGPAI
ncbi:bactofilin family protein [Salinilacihabitans rarus]|uniref:bactofilin family protein n=1 Tax=Salinilacihabitans rarus TaxID=2961596 RepID=UPI0020C847BA|nr:polymer-forming cytoskeletal protein [Salinilacihabitans rarus]